MILPEPAGGERCGRVVSCHRRHFGVRAGDQELRCILKGRSREVACGDRVWVRETAPGEGVIIRADPRGSLLFRSDGRREKLIAANVSLVVAVLAALPKPNEELLSRCLAVAESQNIGAVILLNKVDLPEAEDALHLLRPYVELGYPLVTLCAKRDVGPLLPHLRGQTSVLVGQSGVGKSTLINRLVPEARAAVSEISVRGSMGRQTTTATRLFSLDAQTHVIDSPGFQEFGLAHLSAGQLEAGFREFCPFFGNCRFRDCAHLGEQGCGIAMAAERGQVRPERLEIYRRLRRLLEPR